MPIGGDYFEEYRVLVTVDLSKPGWKNLEPFELLSSVDVVLLGLYQITDQVAPEQARDQFQEEAEERLNVLYDRFQDAGVIVEKSLVFSVDFAEAIDRVADEQDCNAILTWNEKRSFSNIGVLLRGVEQSTHTMDSVASLMVDQDQTVTLINFIEDDDDETDQLERQTILENERNYLIDRGLSENQVELRIEQVSDINDAIVRTVGQFDAIVMGETEPSVASRIFGTRHELVQEHTNGPVLIVRKSHNG